MPIRPELKHLYGKEWRTVIRPRILERDEHRCKFCRKPNHQTVCQITDPGKAMWWYELVRPAEGEAFVQLRTHRGDILPQLVLGLPLRQPEDVRVILTIAHLDHDAENMADENLAALCQWCHLNHDREQHRSTRERRKDAERPLLSELPALAMTA
jgi:5-methylcytosine-specific restriction endonuclease McrA